MKIIYQIGVYGYALLIRVAAWFNPKAKLWVDGRKNWKEKISNYTNTNGPLYWFHCASLGEFEQGKPIMEALRKREDCQIVISFFSPSGYENRKNYDGADLIFYLPIDTKKNASFLINTLKPDFAFFVKYEFWANYIFALKSKQIKLALVSGLFRKDQPFFKWYGSFFKSILKSFDYIFVQNKASKQLLTDINIDSIISGDTRYDRVMKNAKQTESFSEIESFINKKAVFVIGSSWPEDEKLLFQLINQNSFTDKVIIAPHEINENHINEIEKMSQKSTVRFSNLKPNCDSQILIIDNIGMLMHLYQYANIAYVGGGFKGSLHNILEPACFGLPVMFGPQHQKFPEAKLFIKNGIGFEIKDDKSLNDAYSSQNKKALQNKALSFMLKQEGATEKILNQIFN